MFMSLIQKRRSIRKFQETPVEQEKIDLLVEAALRPPSSKAGTPWEFIVVTDRELLERLSESKEHGSAFLKGAPLGIVVCARPERSDVWVEDASIASTFLLLAAESLGLGACWIQIRERMHGPEETAQDYIRRLLGLPQGMTVQSIIAVGHPDETKAPRSRDELQYEKVHLNSYGRPYGRPG
jgi:nitroreductase